MNLRKAQKNLPARINNIQGLVESGFVMPDDVAPIRGVCEKFSVALSPHLAELIEKAGGDGPIAKQYLPDRQELNIRPEEHEDPIGDRPNSPVPGIVHRYPDRVLLKITPVCAVYCRFCFRREMIGSAGKALTELDLERALKYIGAHKEVWEVILTGGDPLILSPARMARVFKRLSGIDHVKIIRLHTRIPVADPDRLSPEMLEVLRQSRKPVYMALHVNHPDEITGEVANIFNALRQAGCSLLSQSVLLRGINDCPEILENLYRRLVELQVHPYEIHHPDMAKGTSHFRVPLNEGQAVIGRLRGRLSGLCQPAYMLDLPGGHGKVEVTPKSCKKLEAGLYSVQDYKGNTHIYRDQ